MIGIRTITYNLPKNFGKDEFNIIKDMSTFLNVSELSDLIRTQRINTFPLTEVVDAIYFKNISELCELCGIRWFNIPMDPFVSKSPQKLFKLGYNILKDNKQAFVHIIGVKDKVINIDFLNQYSNLCKRVSNLSANGADNFRLGLSLNVKPNCPFFPFTMSSGEFGFSIGLELTQEINKIISKNKKISLEELRKEIINQVDQQMMEIVKLVNLCENKFDLKFQGFDFSLAPIIEENGSVIPIIKHLGIQEFGDSGNMFVTAYLTDILKYFASKYVSVGFSGIMYSLLEDFELCKINNKNGVSLKDMIKLSTMCGCGLDMVPVYEKITIEEMRNMILDVCAISCRLDKPLGVRILPIPQTKNSDKYFTSFNNDADFITNTKLLKVCNNNIPCDLVKQFQFLRY